MTQREKRDFSSLFSAFVPTTTEAKQPRERDRKGGPKKKQRKAALEIVLCIIIFTHAHIISRTNAKAHAHSTHAFSNFEFAKESKTHTSLTFES